MDVDHVFKIVIVGDAGVGKSSIMLQFTDDHFDDHVPSTIGVDFKFKVLTIGGQKIKVIIWDTAGQERFRTLTSSYYRGAQGIILVYDVTRKDTFDNLSVWLQEVEQYSADGGRDVIKVLVGNKVDKPKVVARDSAEGWARAQAMMFLEVSAKTKQGIQQVFLELIQKILDNPVLVERASAAKPNKSKNLNIAGGGVDAAGSGSCC